MKKKDGGLRPIAVGCTLRRIISKAICIAIRERAATALAPFQLGVGVPDGSVTAAHADRRFLGSAPAGSGILKLDFRNAFNVLDRTTMLTRCTEIFPELIAYLAASYGAPSHLFFGSFKLKSACGIQQGDPLGPIVFSMAMRPATSNPHCEFSV